MQFLSALCSAMAVVAAAVAAPTDCDVTFDGNTYKEEVVATNLDLPFGFAVDHQTNTLYFTNFDGEKTKYTPAKLNLNTKEQTEITELVGSCSFTIDQQHNVIYAGCLEFDETGLLGLYRYDASVGRFVVIGEQDKYIQSLFYKDVLYYSPQPSYLLHTFANGRSSPVKELTSEVEGVVIDKDNDIIFYNETGLYEKKSGSSEVVHFPGTTNAISLAVDNRGEAYVCDFSRDSVSRVEGPGVGLTKLVDVSWCRGLAFDKDNNMVYADSENNKIIHLLKC